MRFGHRIAVQQHVGMCGATGDHRQAVGFLGHQAIDDDRPVMIQHRVDAGVQASLILDPDALPAIGLGQLHEVGQAVGIAVGVAGFVGQLLPLADHAHVLVVEDEHLDRQAILAGRAQFLDVHLDAGFTRHIDHQRIGIAELRADGGGQAVAHRTKAPAGEPFVGLIEPHILCRPHLVLPDFRGDYGRALARLLVKSLDCQLGHHQAVRAGSVRIGKAVACLPAADPRFPFGQLRRAAIAPGRDQLLQHRGAIAHDAKLHRHDLVDARPVDIDVDLRRSGAERIQPAGHPIVEPRADADHHVAPVHRHVRFVSAVHPQHAEPVRIGVGEGAKSHKRGGNGRVRQALELAQQAGCFGAGIDHSPAGVKDGIARVRDQLDGAVDLVLRSGHPRLVAIAPAGKGGVRRRPIDQLSDLHVLGNVDDDRTGAAGGGDAKRLVDRGFQLAHVLHKIIVLRAVPGDADRIGFLESVGPDQRGRHLSGDHHHGDRVQVGIGNTGHGIGGTRPAGDEHHAGLSGRAGIAFRRVGSACFVTHEDMAQFGMIAINAEQLVIDRQDRTARVPEHEFHPVPDQRIDQYGSAGPRSRHRSVPVPPRTKQTRHLYGGSVPGRMERATGVVWRVGTVWRNKSSMSTPVCATLCRLQCR